MHIRSLTPVALTVAIAGTMFTTSCGSDAEPLTKTEFIAQANTICQRSRAEAEPYFDAIYVDADDLDDADPATMLVLITRWDDAMAGVKPIFDKQLDDIGALEPPKSDKQLIETLLADQQAALDEFADNMAAAAAGDAAALESIESDEDPFADIDRRAREYGLTVCGDSD
jgi:hypothetical protein